MSGCSVTIFQTYHPCLVIGGGSGLSTQSPRSWLGSLPPRSPELLRTRSEMLPPSEYLDHHQPCPSTSPISDASTISYSAWDDIDDSANALAAWPVEKQFCACIWPTLTSWCIVCSKWYGPNKEFDL